MTKAAAKPSFETIIPPWLEQFAVGQPCLVTSILGGECETYNRRDLNRQSAKVSMPEAVRTLLATLS